MDRQCGFWLAAAGMFATAFLAGGVEVFSTNSVWRFRPGSSEASSPVTAWRTNGFNDAEFSNAPAPFWYGDAYEGGTVLANMQNNYSCIFLRRPFVIANPAHVTALRLLAFVDDGFVAWINGVEVARTNVSAAAPTYQTLAANATEPPPLCAYNLPAPSGYLRAGTNVLAVQVFNTSTTSSDLGFDCLLDATIIETIPPTVASVAPAAGTVTALTSVTVRFSEPVKGVQAGDLLVNGLPAGAVVGEGDIYIFSFPEPPPGNVLVSWAGDPGITDLATPPNAFDPQGPAATWQYVLVDTTPPVLADLYPPAGLTLRWLCEVEVVFSEPVQGVDAPDLLVNGRPATNCVAESGQRYRFQFPPPPNGPVSVAWSPGHGITDASAWTNPFAGGPWAYTVNSNTPPADLVITEFLAANVGTNGLRDEDGEQQDWIEIWNRGSTPVNLENWSLSDDPALPGLWRFPARTLQPRGYLVVFASGKDRRPTNSAPLHTNFKLGVAGEPLGLYSPDSPRALVSGFLPYPEQRNDISYGVDSNGVAFYFETPSPGVQNGPGTITGVCAQVHVNVQRGHFTTPFDLRLSCATPGVTFRYTTDGSEPTAASPVFPGALRINKTTLFRAAAFKPGHLPSKTVTHSYLFNLSAGLRSLPVISIVTASNHLYGPSGILGIKGGAYTDNGWQPVAPDDYHNPSKHGLAWERPASVEWIEPSDNAGFQVDCGIRVQGSDYQRPRLTPTSKFSFRLYFRSDYGPGRLEYPLFPLTSVQRFDQVVLRAGFNEQNNPFIRDELHRRLAGDMGQLTSHGTLAVVFVNGVPYAGSPWYNPCERIHEEFFQQHLGGGAEWDVVGPTWAQTAGTPGVIDGDRADFLNLVSYINNYSPTSPTVYSNIARRLDLTNFADYCLLNAYAAMGDWPGNNWRAGRDRAGGPWRFVVWDAEWGMGIYGRSVSLNSFTMSGGGPHDSGLASTSSSEIAQIYNRLRNSQEFRLLWADRVQKHFFNGGALTQTALSNRFNELRAQLATLMPDMDAAIANWIRDRQPIFFSQMQPYGLLLSSNAPAFNQHGGRVPAGFLLVMTNLAGTIYYTTNGADPRVPFTSAVSPSAMAYTVPLPLDRTVTIRARSLNGTAWSAMTEATFTVGWLGVPLRITEVMYNPPGGSWHEFIELQNLGPTPVDLGGMYFDGISFQFKEGEILAGGARLVLGSNTDTNAWLAQYPGVTPRGWFAGNLANGGERLALYDRWGRLVTAVNYDDEAGWPVAADGAGRSLEVIDPWADPDDPANWQPSAAVNGSPGAPNSPPPSPAVRLNELQADNLTTTNHGGTFPDWIELHNPGGSPVNLAGWSLTDDANPRKFVFPAVTLPAGGYLLVWCDASTNTTPGLHAGFALDRDGDRLFLYDASTNRVDAVSFGQQVTDLSLGRVGADWTLTQPTPGTANVAAALASPTNLVWNEWMPNPSPGQPDWVELFNTAYDAPVALRGLYLATSNDLHRLSAPAFVPPRGHVRLFADGDVGPDHLSFKLPAAGGALILYDATGELIQQFNYAAQPEGVSQGRLPDGSANIRMFIGSPSPGTTNYLATYTGPLLNEVLARNKSVNVAGRVADFIELWNTNNVSFNLGGMSLSVGTPQPGEWVFPPNMVLAARAYLVILCDGSQPPSTNPATFNLGRSLDGDSGGVFLFNPAGQLVSSVEYGPQVDDLPLGLSGGQWRLLAAATPGTANAAPVALGSATSLRINEWMADPATGPDWFELVNLTNRPVDLSTLALTDDPSLAGRDRFRPAALSFIAPNGFVKWIADSDPGQGRNHVNFSLDQWGEALVLYAVNGSTYTVVDSVGFGGQTRGVSEGRLPDGAAAITAFPGSPSPGESNYRLLANVVINEVLAHTDPPLEDAIELRNLSAVPMDLSGWFLSNSRYQRRKFRLPADTVLPAGGFRVFYEYQFNDGTTNAFTLNSAHGDEVWLSAATNGVETGERTGVAFGASFNGVSFGCVPTSQGLDFAPLLRRTFGVDTPATLEAFRAGTGLPNAGPVIGPVVINEIHYNPPAGHVEFIELCNISGQAVPLYDPAFPTNRWQLGGGVAFTFPPGCTLQPGAFLLVVDFDPVGDPSALAAFRARYGLSADVVVLGPLAGKLDNDADTVELLRPDTPQLPPHPDAGFVPYVLADRVCYTDAQPWPAGAVDGGGLSLQRLLPTLYGNDPLNWGSAPPSPAAPNRLTLPDADADGIPDAVEFQAGLDMNNPGDAALDADGDGASNLHEYRAGTDPRDPRSLLRLESIALGGSTLLTFHALPGRSYSVLCADAPAGAPWTPLTNVPALPTARMETVRDPDTRATRFYRLVTPAFAP